MTIQDDTFVRDVGLRKAGAGSTHKVLRALLAFSISQPRHSAASLAQELRLPISSIYRYLAILRETKFIDDDGRGTFVLSARVAELAQVAHGTSSLALQARPHMKLLVKSLNQTIILVKRTNDLAVCVACERAVSQTRLIFDVGVALPLTHGAGPKLLLAHLDSAEQLAIINRTQDASQTANAMAEDLMKRLEDVRSKGWSRSESEIQPDVAGIAVGVYDDSGDLIAALSAFKHARQKPTIDFSSTLALLQASAETISKSYLASRR